MKIVTLPANPYHKVGTALDLDDFTANVLINKGFAVAEGAKVEEDAVKKEVSEKTKPTKKTK